MVGIRSVLHTKTVIISFSYSKSKTRPKNGRKKKTFSLQVLTKSINNMRDKPYNVYV